MRGALPVRPGASIEFGPFSWLSANVRYLRTADGWSRRETGIVDGGRGCRIGWEADRPYRRLAAIVDLRRRASHVGGEWAFGVAGSGYPYALEKADGSLTR
jgi:hypothetical protein